MKEIKIDLVNMKFQTFEEDTFVTVELHKNTLVYKGNFTATEPKDREDPLLGDTEETYKWNITVLKSNIVSLEINFNEVEDFDPNWQLTLSISGRRDDINLFFETENQAVKARDEIYNWLGWN